MYSPAKHIVMLNKKIANITNVAKLYNDDEMLNTADETRTYECVTCLRFIWMSQQSVELCVVDCVESSLCDHIFIIDEFFLQLFDFNLVVCLSILQLPTNILGCSIIFLINGLLTYESFTSHNDSRSALA